MSGPGVIIEEPAQMCEMCGVIAECRPYGPNDEQICFDCGMKDKENTLKKLGQYIFGGSMHGTPL